MTTSTHLPRTSRRAADQRIHLRLHLAPHMGEGMLDGSWWPQSRDLNIEFADLVDHFPAGLGEVRRAVFSRPDWDRAPRKVRVARGVIKVGSYPRDDTHQVWLAMSTGRMIRLAVTKPEEKSSDDYAHWNDDGGSWWDTDTVPPSERT